MIGLIVKGLGFKAAAQIAEKRGIGAINAIIKQAEAALKDPKLLPASAKPKANLTTAEMIKRAQQGKASLSPAEGAAKTLQAFKEFRADNLIRQGLDPNAIAKLQSQYGDDIVNQIIEYGNKVKKNKALYSDLFTPDELASAGKTYNAAKTFAKSKMVSSERTVVHPDQVLRNKHKSLPAKEAHAKARREERLKSKFEKNKQEPEYTGEVQPKSKRTEGTYEPEPKGKKVLSKEDLESKVQASSDLSIDEVMKTRREVIEDLYDARKAMLLTGSSGKSISETSEEVLRLSRELEALDRRVNAQLPAHHVARFEEAAAEVKRINKLVGGGKTEVDRLGTIEPILIKDAKNLEKTIAGFEKELKGIPKDSSQYKVISKSMQDTKGQLVRLERDIKDLKRQRDIFKEEYKGTKNIVFEDVTEATSGIQSKAAVKEELDIAIKSQESRHIGRIKKEIDSLTTSARHLDDLEELRRANGKTLTKSELQRRQKLKGKIATKKKELSDYKQSMKDSQKEVQRSRDVKSLDEAFSRGSNNEIDATDSGYVRPLTKEKFEKLNGEITSRVDDLQRQVDGIGSTKTRAKVDSLSDEIKSLQQADSPEAKKKIAELKDEIESLLGVKELGFSIERIENRILEVNQLVRNFDKHIDGLKKLGAPAKYIDDAIEKQRIRIKTIGRLKTTLKQIKSDAVSGKQAPVKQKYGKPGKTTTRPSGQVVSVEVADAERRYANMMYEVRKHSRHVGKLVSEGKRESKEVQDLNKLITQLSDKAAKFAESKGIDVPRRQFLSTDKILDRLRAGKQSRRQDSFGKPGVTKNKKDVRRINIKEGTKEQALARYKALGAKLEKIEEKIKKSKNPSSYDMDERLRIIEEMKFIKRQYTKPATSSAPRRPFGPKPRPRVATPGKKLEIVMSKGVEK